MTTDEQLDACLALEALWDRLGGAVHLSDLGFNPVVTVTGNKLPSPEHWRLFPKAPSVVPPSTTEGAPSALQRWFDRSGDCWLI